MSPRMCRRSLQASIRCGIWRLIRPNRRNSSPRSPPTTKAEGGMDLSRTAWRKSSHSGSETNCVEAAVVPALRPGENDRVAGDELIPGDRCP
ncbi:DUF397 domain-containing protein [Actinoallomurus vinaceus]|uniref:DUF397 domain-containing protein n=1 Tax=Actinoallomurus vinaceus TaxID=1080074 RepID=UPI003CD0663A